MPGEFQKDIKFDDIEAGDLVLVELFDTDGSYLGDRRGVAKFEDDGVWHFDGMKPLYRGALGYRLFRVTVFSAPVDPLDKLEEEIRRQGDLVQAAWDELGIAADDKYFSGKLAGLRLALDLIRQQKEG